MKTVTSMELRLLLGLASITTLLVFPFFTDPVNLPKFILLMSSAFSLVYFVGDFEFKKMNRLNFVKIFTQKRQPVTLSLTLFLASILTSALLSPSPLTGLFGLSGRRSGVFTYLGLFMLFLVAKKFGTTTSLFHYLKALAYVGSIQAIYMLFQYSNLDPLQWDAVYGNRMFGTLGNPNFSSAFLAISFPAIFFCSVSQAIPNRQRNFFRLSAGLVLLAIFLSGVYQGPISLAIASAVTYFVFIQTSTSPLILKRFSYAALSGSALIMFLGVLQMGPLGNIFSKGSFEIRSRGYWPVATELGLSKPFFGVGHEQFINYFPRAFDPEYRSKFGQLVTDNAHNYLFHFFAEGGISVLVSYMAFLLFVSLMLWKLHSKARDETSYILIACIGIWTAFLGQMLVSIDNLGISIWIWILAGLLTGYSLDNSQSTTSTKVTRKSREALQNSGPGSKQRQKKFLTIGSSFLIFSLFAQLAWLDNRVWFLENARKQGDQVTVTEPDMKSLNIRSQIWSFDPTLLARSSSLLLSYGFKEEGFALLNKALSENPESPSLLNLRAAATESIVNRALAVPMRVRELEMDPWNASSSIELIRNLLEQRNLLSAQNEFKRLQTFADSATIEIARNLLLTKSSG